MKPKEVQLEDMLVPVNDGIKTEGGADLDLNPVMQAKLVLESETGKTVEAGKLGSGAHGALRRLLKPLGGNFGVAKKDGVAANKQDKLKQLDRRVDKMDEPNVRGGSGGSGGEEGGKQRKGRNRKR